MGGGGYLTTKQTGLGHGLIKSRILSKSFNMCLTINVECEGCIFDWLLTCLISPWAVKTIASSPSSVLATWGQTEVLLKHQPFGKQRKKEYLMHLLHKSPAHPSLLTCQERCFFYVMLSMWANHILLEIHVAGWKHKSNKEQFGRHFQNNLFICKNFVWLIKIIALQLKKQLTNASFAVYNHRYDKH